MHNCTEIVSHRQELGYFRDSQSHLDNCSGFGRACTWDGSQNTFLRLKSIPRKVNIWCGGERYLESFSGDELLVMMIVTLNFLVIMSITLNFVVKKVDFFLRRKNSCWLWKEATWLPREGWSFHLDWYQIYLQIQKIYNVWVTSDLYNLKRLTWLSFSMGHVYISNWLTSWLMHWIWLALWTFLLLLLII